MLCHTLRGKLPFGRRMCDKWSLFVAPFQIHYQLTHLPKDQPSGPVLLDSKKLVELGYTKWILRAIKLASQATGDSPFVMGRYAYEDDIRAWLKKHPGFVPAHYFESEQRRRLKRAAPHARDDHPGGQE